MPSSAPLIGARLRAARRSRDLSVRGLARQIGVSASLISQIETDKSSPSVSTLYAIATALDISIEDLFGDRSPLPDDGPDGADPAGDDEDSEVEEGGADDADEAAPLLVPGSVLSGQGTAGPEALAALAGLLATGPAPDEPGNGTAHQRIGPVVHPGARETLTLDSGVSWELLGRIPHKHVDFLLITYPPGGTSSTSGLLMRHTGTEYGFVISGELVLTLGFETHRLRAGDSVSFESSTPHAYRNESTEPAVGVWFVLERSP